MTSAKKGHGGKLNRSEIVHLRLNPKMRYALELMARSDNRTVSSLLENLVTQAVKSTNIKILPPAPRCQLPLMPTDDRLKSVSLSEALSYVWDTNEMRRAVLMGLYFPHLLTTEEEVIWNCIRLTDYFWAFYTADEVHEKTGKPLGKRLMKVHSIEGILWNHINEYWDLLKKISDYAAFQEEILPKGIYNKPGKIITPPDGFSTIYKTYSDEELFDMLNQYPGNIFGEDQDQHKKKR